MKSDDKTKLFIESEELRMKNQENYSELDMCLLQLFGANRKDLKNRWKIPELLSYMRKLRDHSEKFKRNNPSILFVLSLLTNNLNVIKKVVINADQFNFGIRYYMFLLNLLCDNQLYNNLEFLIKNYGINLTLIEDINRKS